MRSDRRPYITRRDIPIIALCYVFVWVPIVVALVATIRD